MTDERVYEFIYSRNWITREDVIIAVNLVNDCLTTKRKEAAASHPILVDSDQLNALEAHLNECVRYAMWFEVLHRIHPDRWENIRTSAKNFQ